MSKKVVLTSFEDLVEVFPSLNLSQIMQLYQDVLGTVHSIERIIEKYPEKDHTDLVLRMQDSIKAETFLSGYLARYCCKLCGF